LTSVKRCEVIKLRTANSTAPTTKIPYIYLLQTPQKTDNRLSVITAMLRWKQENMRSTNHMLLLAPTLGDTAKS